MAKKAGNVQGIAARDIGVAGLWLGAGRRQASDSVDPAVGIELHARVGDAVAAGDLLATLHHNDTGLDEAQALVLGAFALSESTSTTSPAGEASRILEILR